MTHPDYIREKAIELRIEKKLTIDEIAECLAIAKTTAYYWVGDIEIPRKPGRAFRTEAQKKGTLAMQDKYKKARDDAYRQGLDEFAELCGDPTFRDFVCMYIGEGSKRNRNRVSICNSDPLVVVLGHSWITKLTSRSVRYSLQFHADQSFDDLTEFWGELLGIDGSLIKFQRKSNSNQLSGRKWRSQHGVLDVGADDTYLRSRLQAWMDLTKAQWQ